MVAARANVTPGESSACVTARRRDTPLGDRVGPALAILEVRSIARGYLALDAMSKRAVVGVVHAEAITPGKFWIAVEGGEAEVDEALAAGIDRAGEARLDHVLLPSVHPDVLSAVARGGVARIPLHSVGVIEVATLAAAVRSADAAMKAAVVTLADLHLARGIGGKGYVVVTGELSDVEAAVDAGADAAGVGALVGREVIANPDAVLGGVTPPPRQGVR